MHAQYGICQTKTENKAKEQVQKRGAQTEHRTVSHIWLKHYNGKPRRTNDSKQIIRT